MFKTFVSKVFNSFGLQVSRVSSKYRDALLYEDDNFFNELYDRGMRITQTPDSGHKRKARFYNLVQFYQYIHKLDGKTAECGCWKGLSSLLVCSYEKKINPTYRGQLHEIYDSFEGLSVPALNDTINNKVLASSMGKCGGELGDFSENLSNVQNSLKEFPGVNYNKGWIPDVFELVVANDCVYKFVHIDVDLYEPTLGSFEYFYPKLVTGGIIICDDYGSLRWPGAKKAVEEYCNENKIDFIALSTGQAVVIKK